jgi:hypothetical protein
MFSIILCEIFVLHKMMLDFYVLCPVLALRFPALHDGEENKPYLPYNIAFKSIYHTPVDAQPAGC